MRSLLGVVMTVVMAVTSLSAAHARGQAAPVGTMVICRGLTVATVLIGADGQPVEVQHICPDAALALFVETGAVPPPITQAFVWQAVQWDAPVLVAGSRGAIAAQARGPPAFL
ncbi:hypothetical protein [Antarctobacter sp.]|uniref:hypothetical protein n=1 Tax=Antarctobacter sp. TaxID=1872577 RepID=UPI003A8E7FDF